MKYNKIDKFESLGSQYLSKFYGGKMQKTSRTSAGGFINDTDGKDDAYTDDNQNNKMDIGECLYIYQ